MHCRRRHCRSATHDALARSARELRCTGSGDPGPAGSRLVVHTLRRLITPEIPARAHLAGDLVPAHVIAGAPRCLQELVDAKDLGAWVRIHH